MANPFLSLPLSGEDVGGRGVAAAGSIGVARGCQGLENVAAAAAAAAAATAPTAAGRAPPA